MHYNIALNVFLATFFKHTYTHSHAHAHTHTQHTYYFFAAQ